MFEAFDEAIFLSLNSGTTWSRAAAPIAGYRYISGSSDLTTMAVSAQLDGAFFSVDLGQTWQVAEIDGE